MSKSNVEMLVAQVDEARRALAAAELASAHAEYEYGPEWEHEVACRWTLDELEEKLRVEEWFAGGCQ